MPIASPFSPAGYDQQLLAAIRTRLANERTLLTYVRTALALTGFGLALLQLEPRRTKWLGIGAIVTAALLLISYVRFCHHARQIEQSRLRLPLGPKSAG